MTDRPSIEQDAVRTGRGLFLPYAEWREPCGFQGTFFECPPDCSVTRRVYGWTRARARRRAEQTRVTAPGADHG